MHSIIELCQKNCENLNNKVFKSCLLLKIVIHSKLKFIIIFNIIFITLSKSQEHNFINYYYKNNIRLKSSSRFKY